MARRHQPLGRQKLPFGHLVATAVVARSEPVEDLEPDIWGDYRPGIGRYGWVLEDVRPLPDPIAVRGSQGIFFAEIPTCDLP